MRLEFLMMNKQQIASTRTIAQCIQAKQRESFPRSVLMHINGYTQDEWEEDRRRHIQALQAAFDESIKVHKRSRDCISITHGYHMPCAKAGEHANADDPVEL